MALRVGGGVSKREGGMKCIVPFAGVTDGTVMLNAFPPCFPFISMRSDPFGLHHAFLQLRVRRFHHHGVARSCSGVYIYVYNVALY